jgi:uncharacterized protein (DUF433 family)
MALTIQAEYPPLTTDQFGTIRVANTRVSLDLIVRASRQGLSAEQIAERFDVISLGDVYSVLGYYHRHRSEVDAYLARQTAEADQVRARVESPFPSRQELLARVSEKGTAG